MNLSPIALYREVFSQIADKRVVFCFACFSLRLGALREPTALAQGITQRRKSRKGSQSQNSTLRASEFY